MSVRRWRRAAFSIEFSFTAHTNAKQSLSRVTEESSRKAANCSPALAARYSPCSGSRKGDVDLVNQPMHEPPNV
ncbi:hypothetical protein M569_10904 [Genlisea aurea]|uniref:Uncharacterized protein n=1 Tax=Genlisea aurea TaxID=192259 RepID=S8DLN6_9LAMI|nr:hypothetical protein M569_10904 [Genlisea aurea]